MPVTINDIPCWLVIRGISHILMSSGNWNFTACGTMTNVGTVTTQPTRKCKRCLEQLGNIKPIEKKGTVTHGIHGKALAM